MIFIINTVCKLIYENHILILSCMFEFLCVYRKKILILNNNIEQYNHKKLQPVEKETPTHNCSPS